MYNYKNRVLACFQRRPDNFFVRQKSIKTILEVKFWKKVYSEQTSTTAIAIEFDHVM